MRHKFIQLCAAILLFLCCPVMVNAQEIDLERTGSISVTLKEKNEELLVAGAELSVYYIAVATIGNEGEMLYRHTEAFETMGVALDDPMLSEKLDAFVEKNIVPCTKLVTNAQGKATCSELPLGLYFVKQTGMTDGFAPCKSFLVSVPAKPVDKYVYDVDASPKTDVEKLVSITIVKEWNVDKASQVTDSVTVQLLQDDKVIKTAVLSDANDWMITYENMPESDSYSIKEVDVPKGFTATYEEYGYGFVVTNTGTLAQTGQLVWPIPVFAIAGLFFLVLGGIILRKDKAR